ncbi:hypothetical protein KKD03_03185 [Patescibacteria group bacterium]|nr:hypothetical protein [Patescibacteria group bacterium]
MKILLNIPQSKWDNSNISRALASFPGQILTYVKKTDAAAILRLEQWLSIILWRWYFLVNDSLTTSPYLYLIWRHDLENWPKESQFLVIAKTNFIDQKINITLDVDAIDFNQQPLLVDLLNVKSKINSKTNLFFPNDSVYTKLIENLKLEFTKDVKDIKGFTENKNPNKLDQSQIQLTKKIVVYLLDEWHKTDEIINKSWTKVEWQGLWSWVFSFIQKEDELTSEMFSDKIIKHTRKTMPTFGLTGQEMEQMEQNNASYSRSQASSQFMFWLNCTRFFTLPLSWYLHLVAPVFLEQLNFDQDIKDTLTNFFEDPILLFNPFSAISLTSFGSQVLTEDLWR